MNSHGYKQRLEGCSNLQVTAVNFKRVRKQSGILAHPLELGNRQANKVETILRCWREEEGS